MSTNEKDALKRIRIANLSRLAELNGSRSRLAEILGKAPQQINDMIRGTKSFGARIAREIEDKLDLPPGTLDTENAELGNPPSKHDTFQAHTNPFICAGGNAYRQRTRTIR